MLLDPLSALSLAGNVLQFVDFASKIVSEGHQIHKSTTGSLLVNDELENIATDLLAVLERVKGATSRKEARALSTDEQALDTIATQCAVVGQELVIRLEELKMQKAKYKWQSIYQALKTTGKRSEIERISKRLSAFRDEMDFHLLVTIRSCTWMQVC